MSKEQQNEQNKSRQAVFVCESQPPHTAEYVAAITAATQYDKLMVCVSSKEKCMNLKTVAQIWQLILAPYRNKVTVVSTNYDFAEIPSIPEMFQECTILTISKKVLTHLSSLGVEVELMPRVTGFHTIFQRAAYKQGKALDFLSMNQIRK